MKTLEVPFVPGLASRTDAEILSLLEASGSRFYVDRANWPDAFGYMPVCAGSIARYDDGLAIRFHVSGLDLRARNLEDNGRQWEDSCCEFFVQEPGGDRYFNFEVNCIGRILGASGAGRHERVRQAPADLARIRRITTLPVQAYDEADTLRTWDIAVLIPFALFGADPACPPASLKANFYKCGDETAHPHFLSWSPIDTPRPDFHRPEFFGKLVLRP